jgi:hypothetical protein
MGGKRLTLITLVLMAIAALGDPKDKPISLQRENLIRWKNSPVTQGLRKAFKSLRATKKNCSQCGEPFEGAFRYMKLYERPFLTVDMEPNDFGGYFVLLVMRDYPRVFEAWVYRLANGEYKLRELNPLEPKLNNEVMGAIADVRLTSFWIRPLPLSR